MVSNEVAGVLLDFLFDFLVVFLFLFFFFVVAVFLCVCFGLWVFGFCLLLFLGILCICLLCGFLEGLRFFDPDFLVLLLIELQHCCNVVNRALEIELQHYCIP